MYEWYKSMYFCMFMFVPNYDYHWVIPTCAVCGYQCSHTGFMRPKSELIFGILKNLITNHWPIFVFSHKHNKYMDKFP